MVITSKLKQQSNSLDYFFKNCGGRGNEIILSKIDRGNELKKLRICIVRISKNYSPDCVDGWD